MENKNSVYKSKEDMSSMALEAQMFLIESYKRVDWTEIAPKFLINLTRSLMITVKRGRTVLKRNPNISSKKEWMDVIEACMEILHTCIIQINAFLIQDQLTTVEVPMSFVIMADYIKLCNDEEDVRNFKNEIEFTTLDGENIAQNIDNYLS